MGYVVTVWMNNSGPMPLAKSVRYTVKGAVGALAALGMELIAADPNLTFTECDPTAFQVVTSKGHVIDAEVVRT